MVEDQLMSIWKSGTNKKDKPWGQIECWSAPWGMCGKIIRLKADQRTSLKYYLHKREVLFCLCGKAVVHAPEEFEFGDNLSASGAEFYLEAGDVLLVQPENPYRIKALEDCTLIEITSGGQSDQCQMLDDDYGRARDQKSG